METENITDDRSDMVSADIGIVEKILQQAAEKEKKFKATFVEKHIPLEFDIGNLLGSDSNDLDTAALRSNCNIYLRNLCRDNTQLLFNEIWTLPTKTVDDVITVTLPAGTTLLPREKPIPKPKPLTKWQQFAKEKGIKSKKKGNLQWDDVVKEWIPRYGYKRSQVEKKKNWLIEVPSNADPLEDQLAKRKFKKSERVAKNELQRLKNIARQQNVNIPGSGFPTQERPSTDQLRKAVTVSRHATASLGKFQEKLPKEKERRMPGTRQKFHPNVMSVDVEKKKDLKVANKIFNQAPKLDVNKAVGREIYEEQQKRSTDKSSATHKKVGRNSRRGGNIGKKGKKLKMKMRVKRGERKSRRKNTKK